jgi:hypothetical protein
VAKFLLEVEGTSLDIDEEISVEDRITDVMRNVAESAARLRRSREVAEEQAGEAENMPAGEGEGQEGGEDGDQAPAGQPDEVRDQKPAGPSGRDGDGGVPAQETGTEPSRDEEEEIPAPGTAAGTPDRAGGE